MGGCLLPDDVLAPAQPLVPLTLALLPQQVEGRVFILVPVRGRDGDGLQLAAGLAAVVIDGVVAVAAVCHHCPLCLLPPAAVAVEVVVVVWSCCC